MAKSQFFSNLTREKNFCFLFNTKAENSKMSFVSGDHAIRCLDICGNSLLVVNVFRNVKRIFFEVQKSAKIRDVIYFR